MEGMAGAPSGFDTRHVKSAYVPKRAIATIHALCATGWPAEVFVPALLEALHGIIPSARNLFDWTDDAGRLLRYFVEGPVDIGVAKLYFEQFHNRREPACMQPFAVLQHAPAGVRSASTLHRADFYASELYNEIWRPQGLHTRIEGVVRSRTGRLLGSLVLYRGPDDLPFTSADERLLDALLPPIARALQCCAIPDADAPHLPGPESAETFLLDLHGRLLNASPGAARLLMLADGGITRDALQRPLADRVDHLFGRLIDQLRSRASAGAAASLRAWPSLSIFNGYGRFDADGILLCSAGQRLDGPLAQVTLRRLEPREVALQRVLRNLPVTVGQAAVGSALYAGRTQPEIARDLGVAASTVVDHVRKLYSALEVGSISELRALLDRRLADAAH